MVADFGEFEQESGLTMRTTHVDKTSSRASTKPFSTLRHIPIASLELGEHHRGARVEGVVCCKAIRSVAVQILLEDVKNASHAVKVSLYNFVPSSSRIADVRRLLPEGTRLAIREPYYKAFMDGTSGIRVDNPADVVFITDTVQTPQESELVNFDELKAVGNQAYRSPALHCIQATHRCSQATPSDCNKPCLHMASLPSNMTAQRAVITSLAGANKELNAYKGTLRHTLANKSHESLGAELSSILGKGPKASVPQLMLQCRCKDFVQAQALYKKCLQQRTDSIVILSNLAAVHIELGDYPDALKYAQDALKLDATHVKSLYRCGVAQMHLQEYSKAIQVLNQAKQQVSVTCPLWVLI